METITIDKVEFNENDLSHSMVHYLLTIHRLKEARGYARVTDIARELSLTKGSVSTALSNLKRKDLVREEDDCKFLVLTEKGHDVVHRILSSRALLYHFLKDFVGVTEEVAVKDACMMEHLLSHETLEKFFQFMKDKGANFGSSLDLESFANVWDFKAQQKS